MVFVNYNVQRATNNFAMDMLPLLNQSL